MKWIFPMTWEVIKDMFIRVVRKWSKLMVERFSKHQQLPFDLKIGCSQMDFG